MSLRIVVIAPLRFPIRQPFAGGLESAVWHEVRLLRRRGHDVTLIATEGSDFLDERDDGNERGERDERDERDDRAANAFVLPAVEWGDDPTAADDTYPAGYLEVALPALDAALDRLAASSGGIDVVLNHCLHGLPLARAAELGTPMISTLHTPVVQDLVDAHDGGHALASTFLSVSRHTRAVWRDAGIDSTVLPNAVDSDRWPAGAGGEGFVWFGRLVPEKGAHLAIDAARAAGRRITLAGRIGDRAYFDRDILPRLGDDAVYAGQLPVPELAALVGRSACALVTPLWDEPFGLITPEALTCGTPVAAFARGGVVELAATTPGLETVPAGEVERLAATALGLAERQQVDPAFRESIRAAALDTFSLDSRGARLEAIIDALIRERTDDLSAAAL
jgi:glycosyltransferase involved in cell wall biosynthesis